MPENALEAHVALGNFDIRVADASVKDAYQGLGFPALGFGVVEEEFEFAVVVNSFHVGPAK